MYEVLHITARLYVVTDKWDSHKRRKTTYWNLPKRERERGDGPGVAITARTLSRPI